MPACTQVWRKWITAALLLLSCAGIADAQQLSDTANRRIETLAAIVHADHQRAVEILAELDFPSDDWTREQQQWRGLDRWPLVRRLETAWIAAEDVEAGQGDRFLRAFAQRVGDYNAAITAEPDLVELFEAREERLGFTFKPPGEIAQARLDAGTPPRVRRIVEAVAKHASSYPGGPTELVRVCCDIAESRAYELQRQAASLEDVLTRAVQEGELPPEAAERLKLLFQEALHFDAAVAAELADPQLFRAAERYLSKGSSLAQLRAADTELGFAIKAVATGADAGTDLADAVGRQLAGTVADLGTPAHAGSAFAAVDGAALDVAGTTAELAARLAGQAGTQAAASQAGNRMATALAATRTSPSTAAYRGFQIREYGAGALGGRATAPGVSRSGYAFSSVVRSSRGFGGIVFGNALGVEADVAEPLAAAWHPRPSAGASEQEAQGALAVMLADRRLVLSPPMFASDLMAAMGAVYGIPGVAKPLADGEALGLVGFNGQIGAYEITDDRVVPSDVTAASFLVHPALAGSEVGKSAIMVDAMPFLMKESLLAETQREDVGVTERPLFKRWLETPWSTYKFIDVPMTIAVDDAGIVHARRTDPPAGSPAELTQSAFVTKVIFDQEGDAISGSDALFYPLVPELTVISAHFARINDFAQVLALVRWLKSANAMIRGLPELTPAATAWSTIYIDDDNEQVSFGPDKHEMARRFAKDVERRAQEILAAEPRLAALRPVSERILNNRLERIALGFVLESVDLRVIANTHLTPADAETLIENAAEAAEARFSREYEQVQADLAGAVDDGDLNILEAIMQLERLGTELAERLVMENAEDALRGEVAGKPRLAGDLDRWSALREKAATLAGAYDFDVGMAAFLEQHFEPGSPVLEAGPGSDALRAWFGLQESYAEACPSGACL